MNALHISKPISEASSFSLRLWLLPALTAVLILIDQFWAGMNNIELTMVAAVAIVVAGIPHGTLDAEIAATHFGQNNRTGKTKIILGYVACVLAMIALWTVAPEFALVSFLVISIVHFSQDWRSGADPFLAMMVGWALVGLPALARPTEVAMIFEMLTGNQNGQIIAALLACASVPAALGSLVFAYWSYANNDMQSALEVIACVVAALFLPPLIAFAVFFCGLHSPRHFAEALRQTGAMSQVKKAAIIFAVFVLSIGLGILLFASQSGVSVDAGIIRAAFVLISTLTLPHFILEHLMAKKAQAITR
jgi:Brp/Blh family beta-carotene 15,15'-monooxygenase